MGNNLRRFTSRAIFLLFALAFGATITQTRSPAQQGLKTIRSSQGGSIQYGQVEGETTEAGAMGAILGDLHRRYGDRPKVGRLFDVRGSESVAVFFSLTKQGGGKLDGMIIAAKATSDHVEAAVLTDDASRFSRTLSPMTKALFAAWHPLEAARAGNSVAAVATLHSVTLQDNSASIGLPDGWRLVQRMSMMGSVVAQGPNGESAEMGITFLAADPSNPTVQRTMQTVQNGGLRNTAYATATYLPYNSDMAKSFVYQIQKVRQKAGLQPADYEFSSVTSAGQSAQERCAHLEGTVDFQDGKGKREMSTLYCTYAPNRFGNWASNAYMTTIPMLYAARERATMGAILSSFQVNMAVVNRQANQIAQPEIDRIHAIGRAAAEQARQAHQMEDIHNSSVYKHWDDMDKRSQEFENYQLGYAVISTTDHNAHGTFDADEAAALVQQNPDKYEYVSAPNYWKGIDY